MSNIVPPLLSNSPPPMVGVLDEEEDEFGDFAVATDLSYGCDALSLPSSPRKSTQGVDESIANHCQDGDTNCSQITNVDASKNIEKDFQDRRKIEANSCESERTTTSSIGQEISVDASVNNLLYNSNKISTKLDNKYNSFQYFPEIPPDILPENDEDEFADGQNHFLEEFEEFQDFETSKASDNDIVEVAASEISTCANPAPSLELASQTPPNLDMKAEKIEADCTNCDEVKSDDILAVQVEGQSLDIKEMETACKGFRTDTVNSESITSSNSGEAGSEGRICNDSEDVASNDTPEFANTICNLQPESAAKDNGSEQISLKDDTASSKDEEDASFRDAMSSGSEDLEEQGVAKDIPLEENFKNQFEPPEDQINNDFSSECHVNDEADDDFADFESVAVAETQDFNTDPFNSVKVPEISKNFGNFDDQIFADAPRATDDFGDFSNFSSSDAQVDSKQKPKGSGEEDDDFGDFSDYAVQTQSSQDASDDAGRDVPQLHRLSSVDIEAIPQKAQSIILEMFPLVEQSAQEYHQQDFTVGNFIFEGLKDVTDTSALLYQWSKSISQGFLLQALNIDTRNILYGPRWNESMPRYAATLGFTPLEPVKSEVLTPTVAEASAAAPPSQPPFSEVPQQTDIPSAQFDWVGAGLTNPLEMTPKKIVERQESQIKESKNNAATPLTPTVIAKPTEAEIKPTTFEFATFTQPETSTVAQTQDSESVKSLQLNDETQIEEIAGKVENVDFDDFASFQASPKSEENVEFPSWSFNNSVPLRETHISNHGDSSYTKVEKVGFEEPGWLKPTILTPDLPRKDNVVSVAHEEEDEFADFQTSQAASSNETALAQPQVKTIEWENKADFGVATNVTATVTVSDDDEFTDFQSILPNPNPVRKPACAPPEPLQPSSAMFEPLTPCVLQPTVSTNSPAVINWPDPGITDYDLQHIELNYQPNAASVESEEFAEPQVKEVRAAAADKSGLPTPKCASRAEPSKTEDDDDWSDFVSSQGPAEPPVIPSTQQLFNKTTNQVKQPSRTSTPELQLCVPQLNQIQIPKKPVPIITQEGLLQTKLSANLPKTIEPLVQPSVQQTGTYPQTSQLQNGFQPSLISNQFAQFGQGLMYPTSNFSSPMQKVDAPKQTKPQPQYFPYSQPSKPPMAPISSSRPEEHDDEWTDFVSSQPAPSMISNGIPKSSLPKPNFDWNRPPQFTSWSANVTPNIITNPVSFDSFQSYSSPAHSDLLKNRTTNRRNPSVVVQPKKSTVPSISTVPDLEFIAPKNRTWKK